MRHLSHMPEALRRLMDGRLNSVAVLFFQGPLAPSADSDITIHLSNLSMIFRRQQSFLIMRCAIMSLVVPSV